MTENKSDEMQRHETAEVSEDADRTTEAHQDLAAKFEETAYHKHLFLIKQNTDLRLTIRKLQDELAHANARADENAAMVRRLTEINNNNAAAAMEHLRQRDEAQLDTARLDWLAESGVDVILSGQHFSEEFDGDPCSSLRAAIDAAREAAK